MIAGSAVTLLRRVCAIALFTTIVATIAVMWIPDFWTTAVAEVPIFAIAAGILLVSLWPSAAPVRLNWILLPLGLATLWPILQILAGTTIYRWNTVLSMLYWGAALATVFIGLQIFGDHALRRAWLRALVVLGFVIAVWAPLQMHTSGDRIYWLFETKYAVSPMGPFVYMNQYAAFIEILLPVAMTEVICERSGWKVFHGLAALVMYASVLASASRTGFVLTTAEMVAVPLLAATKMGISRRLLIRPAAAFLLLLIVIGIAVGPERLIDKLGQKNPYSGRKEFVESSLRMIPARPVMGFGLRNWYIAYPAYATFDDGLLANQAHNDWLQWVVEGGFPFALFMGAVALWSLRAGLRTVWALGVPVVFLQCFVDYPIQRIGVALAFFAVMAAGAYPDDRLRASGRRTVRDY